MSKLSKNLSRRQFLKLAGNTAAIVGAGAMVACAPVPPAPEASSSTASEAAPAESSSDGPLLATVVRSLSNDYHASVAQGAEKFAASIGLQDNWRGLFSEGDSERQLTLMKSLITESDGNVVFYIDPNQSPDARPIAELLAENEIYFTTIWNKPDDLHPWDFNPYYVCHMSVNGVPGGKFIAEEMFKAMGGGGKIVALQGLLANVPAIERFNGLQQAIEENGNVELLAEQTAEWDRTKAVSVMENWLVQFGDEIQGVWAANDNMALGALEALKTAGLAGQVPVVGIDGVGEAIDAIIAGEMVATVGNDPHWQGGMGLALAYHAHQGVFDPASESEEHREFYHTPLQVTPDNAADVKANYIESVPTYDYDDLWGRVESQIQYSS